MAKVRRKAAAKYVGLSHKTLEKYAVTGEGPVYYKIGSTVIYDTEDLDAWLAKHRRMSTSDIGGQV